MGESYRDLFVWRESVEVAASIVTLTDEFPKPKCFALIDQMQRSAISVPSNIAEGKGRLTTRELRHFVCIARGSLFELQTQLEIARKLNLIEPHAYENLLPRMQKIGVGINNWLRKLNLTILNTSKPKHLNT
jgi:S23 ribosomal protein.